MSLAKLFGFLFGQSPERKEFDDISTGDENENGLQILRSQRVRRVQSSEELPTSSLPYPGVTLTQTECCLTADDDNAAYRAQMPCGHVLSADAIKLLVNETLERNSVTFTCPAEIKDGVKCARTWDYPMIRRVARLTATEKSSIENKMAEISLMGQQKAKKCPGCQTPCVREGAVQPAKCGICKYEFCWNCLQKWQRSLTGGCSNYRCTGKDDRLEHLRLKSKRKNMHGVEGYDLRVCPWCGVVVNHAGGCKHMECKACKNYFCFVCLGKCKNGKWPCGSYNSHCKLAPIQTQMPS